MDLEIGVLGEFAPEIRAKAIYRDRFVGAVRDGHPLLEEAVTPERYASARHVVASRRGSFTGPVDEALAALGLTRATMIIVPGFSDALRVARRTDLVALVPRSALDGEPSGVAAFELPLTTPEIVVSALWHPRMDADAGHRWLRETVLAECRLVGTERLLVAAQPTRVAPARRAPPPASP